MTELPDEFLTSEARKLVNSMMESVQSGDDAGGLTFLFKDPHESAAFLSDKFRRVVLEELKRKQIYVAQQINQTLRGMEFLRIIRNDSKDKILTDTFRQFMSEFRNWEPLREESLTEIRQVLGNGKPFEMDWNATAAGAAVAFSVRYLPVLSLGILAGTVAYQYGKQQLTHMQEEQGKVQEILRKETEKEESKALQARFDSITKDVFGYPCGFDPTRSGGVQKDSMVRVDVVKALEVQLAEMRQLCDVIALQLVCWQLENNSSPVPSSRPALLGCKHNFDYDY